MVRTTVTLDDDVVEALRRAAADHGGSFKKALNAAVRAGLQSAPDARPYEVPTRRMGVRPHVDLDRALRLADDLDDDEVLRKLALRK